MWFQVRRGGFSAIPSTLAGPAERRSHRASIIDRPRVLDLACGRLDTGADHPKWKYGKVPGTPLAVTHPLPVGPSCRPRIRIGPVGRESEWRPARGTGGRGPGVTAVRI
jgi:hypothetical protein